jgi:hypothetical protein
MRGTAVLALALGGCSAAPAPGPAALRLEDWERGIAVRSLERPGMDMYLWFYEWNLFDAFEPGESSPGSYELERWVSADGLRASVRSDVLSLKMRVDGDGVALELTAVNASGHDWPEIAAIIPCFNPGPSEVRNQELAHHRATWYLGVEGPERVLAHEIHFDRALRERVMQRAVDGEFGFSKKWPTSERDAVGGLVLRESRDGTWVTGIAWEQFLSVQAHNPWQCMHLAARVGPLAVGEVRTVAGRIWHLAGARDDLVERYRLWAERD